ncbi:MAG TPA: carboxypeptidase regulatory-like domain-containing protein [Dokdonella sp.]
MNVALIVAILIAAAAVLGSLRARRAAAGYRAALIALQTAAAVLLYACLFPPLTQEDFAAGELVVLTPAATPEQLAALSPAATLVALPGAPESRRGERVPDLSTALRRHPETRSLHIVGAGLPVRDRDAARALVARFDAAPLLPGVVELEAPAWVHAGHLWRVAGRVDQVAQGRAELRDPAGAVVAAAALDAQGRFALNTPAKGAGEALFALRIVDRNGAKVDEVAVPLIARAGEPLKLLLLAGAPDAELKYLRRWAVDAGVQLDSRLSLTEGIALTEGAPAIDAQALRAADVAVVDERAWAALSAAQKQMLSAAVRDGLGLLLRVTGPLSAQVAEEWAALGFRTQARDAAATVSLGRTLALGDFGLDFARRPLDVEAGDAAALLRGDDDAALALWRNEGGGRVAVWWLADSYRLALGGLRAQYGTLWSDALATLARAHADAAPQLPREARVGERAVLCGIEQPAFVETEQGERVDLDVERSAAGRPCAGYWPLQAGWHSLVAAERHWAFRVRAADEAPALRRAEDAAATRLLMGASSASASRSSRSLPLPRWPFFLGWLATIALLWWLERRSRLGTVPAFA